jgi:uncharacterized membrane protein
VLLAILIIILLNPKLLWIRERGKRRERKRERQRERQRERDRERESKRHTKGDLREAEYCYCFIHDFFSKSQL